MMFPKGTHIKRKRTKARASMPESALQKQCEQYLDLLDLTYIRIPDTMNSIVFGSPSIPVHVKTMIAAFTKGVPDLTILHSDGRYLCIELKTEIGKVNQNQKKWARNIISQYHVVRTFYGFRDLVDEWNS